MANDQSDASQQSSEAPPESAAQVSEKEERTWALACHLSALSAYVGVPFGHIIGPLIVWLVKKDQMPMVDDQGKEALNFNLSVTIYGLVSGILVFVLVGIVLLAALAIFHLVITIVAAVNAYGGTPYRYPLTIRFIK